MYPRPITPRFRLHPALLVGLIFTGLCSGVSTAAAPGTVGTMAGVVTNAATGELLAHATLRVEGTAITATTERGGDFSLPVPAGRHVLLISYTGLETAQVVFDVPPGGTVRRTIALTSEIYRMEPFSVAGLREGTALSLQAQRQAVNVKNVAASDMYGNPSANVGELLQRMPGIIADIIGGEVSGIYIRGMDPGFSSLMIDGNSIATATGTLNSRGADISQFGTGNIDSVELVKAPTPDMDANAVSGFVNLITKRGFDQPGRRIGLVAGTMWKYRGFSGSPIRDKPDGVDQASFSFSDVYGIRGERRNLGVALNLNRRRSTVTQDETGAALGVGAGFYILTDPSRPLQRNFGAGDTTQTNITYNAGLNIDLKLTDTAVVYLKTSANVGRLQDASYRSNFSTSATAANYTPTSNAFGYQEVLPNNTSVINAITMSNTVDPDNYSIGGGLEARLFDRRGKLTIDATHSHAELYSIRLQSTAELRGTGWALGRRGHDRWYPNLVQTAGPSLSDPDNYRATAYFHAYNDTKNDLNSIRADYRHSLATAWPSYVQVGTKYYVSSRWERRKIEYFTYAGAPSIRPFLGYHHKQGAVHYGPIPFIKTPSDPHEAPGGTWIQTSSDVWNTITQTNTNNVDFEEAISAAYVMGHVNAGKVRLLGGMRLEQTDVEGVGFIVNTSAAAGTTNVPSLPIEQNAARAQRQFAAGRTSRSSSYRHVFPGLHLVYEPADGLLVRASYNTSIARPPVANIIPKLTVNDDTRVVSQGNPALKPYESDNFEVAVQRFFEPGGLIEVSAFLKEIKGYFRTLPSIVADGPYAGYVLNQVQNTGDARIRGLEFSYRQQYNFLPGFWSGFGSFVSANYQQAEGKFATTAFQKRLGGFSPRNGNAGLSYVKYGLEARMMANYTSQTYQSGAGLSSMYTSERLMFDLKVQYKFNRRYSMYLDVINLTNEPTRSFVLENDLPLVQVNQGIGFSAGVKASF